LVIVVPTGMELPAPATSPVLKGVHSQVGANDRVVIWCGALREFDDPMTAIRAVAMIRAAEAVRSLDTGRMKLVFSAFEDETADDGYLECAAALADELGVSRAVVFLERVPAHLRGAYLAEADLGVRLLQATVEAQLREPDAIITYVAAGLPMVITSGCVASAWVQRYRLGRLAGPGNVASVAGAIAELLGVPRTAFRDHFGAAREAQQSMVEGLKNFCVRPELALDRQVHLALVQAPQMPVPRPTPVWQLPRKLWWAVRDEGMRGATRQVAQYLSWVATR
jgi:glycosyltransferase involved in cell wall biosynthesis